MESLPRNHGSRSKTSVKFTLKCQEKITLDNPTTKDWLKIVEKLDRNVLKGILFRKQIVVKYDIPRKIIDDYNISEKLCKNNIPNYIKYICYFVCPDNVSDIATKQFLCKAADVSNEILGFIVMPYYSLGSVGNQVWSSKDLNIYKSILKQICFASVYAFFEMNFVHKDLHLDNILLRKTKKETIFYGSVEVKTFGMYAIIMDFDRLKVNNTRIHELFDSLYKVCTLSATIGEKSDIVLDVINLTQLLLAFSSRENAKSLTCSGIIQELEKVIESVSIRYVKSEIFNRK